jgi:hypothetical protein
MYNTHEFGNEKNEYKAYNIELQPGLYSFRIFGNNSFGNATSGELISVAQNIFRLWLIILYTHE